MIVIPKQEREPRLTRRTPDEIARLREGNASRMREYMAKVMPVFTQLGIASEQITEQPTLGTVIVSGISVQQRNDLTRTLKEMQLGIGCDDSEIELIQ